MGNQVYFQQKAAQVLRELIKTNMYFYNLFWSQQISIISLENCHPAVMVLTLALLGVLDIFPDFLFCYEHRLTRNNRFH